MMGPSWVMMFFLLAGLGFSEEPLCAPAICCGEVRVRAEGSKSVPGSPCNISKNDRGLRRAVLTATYSFNNQSNDAFLFKPSAIHKAQKQIIKGIRYIVDMEISRTVCHKRQADQDLSKCDYQPDGLLHQTFSCHFEVWAIPWLHVMKTTFFICRP